MSVQRRLLAALMGLVILAGLIAWQGFAPLPAAGANDEPTPETTEGPHRKAQLNVPFTSYQWWLNSWQTNEVVCQMWVEHQGLPTRFEVANLCDPAAFDLWSKTTTCPQADTGGDVHQCPGVYMHMVGSQDAEREVTVNLPPPTVWVSVSGCDLAPPAQNRCDHLPDLLLTGEEPLPNETIISIHGLLGGESFSCPGASCTVPLPPTGMQGIPVEFWADSSYGDSSQHFTAQVRTVPWGDFMSPEGQSSDQQLWYVDVLSTQWRGAPLASCSEIWESFPSLGGPPQWLTTPERVEDLVTNQPLYFLAGVLIESGEVDARDCPEKGLAGPGVANQCGLEAAQPKMETWQNQFDSEIIQVGKDTGVPAQLMKNVFARESQFWPGIYRTFREAGLGQLTENGADTTLLWNPDFFNQFCPLIFQKDVCAQGWTRITEEQQNLLKGTLVNKVNAACPDCPAGIDLTRAKFSVTVFAETLRANCQQAGQIVYNVNKQSAGLSASYEDLWLFTLVNYNAGPGCLSHAVQAANGLGEPLDWAHVGNHLEPACLGAVRYVQAVTSIEAPRVALTETAMAPTAITPVVIPTSEATATPQVSGTPAATHTPGPTPTGATPTGPTPRPTATTEGYPYPEPGYPTITPGPSPTSEAYP